jgi:cobalamin biosynthesis Mg chelatase CobN
VTVLNLFVAVDVGRVAVEAGRVTVRVALVDELEGRAVEVVVGFAVGLAETVLLRETEETELLFSAVVVLAMLDRRS